MRVIEREDGMTLVELIVAILVGGLVLGLLGGLFVNGVTAQQQAAARDRATAWANTATTSLSSQLRNATADLTLIHSGSGLVARVIAGDGDWSCRSWLVQDDGSIRYLDHGKTQISSAEAAAGVQLVEGSIDLDTNEGDGARGRFDITGRTVAIELSIAVGEVSVSMSDAVTTQGALGEEAGSCWSGS
jgi:prepilin-type N-terminal cleavage/methylation domain-containing protein